MLHQEGYLYSGFGPFFSSRLVGDPPTSAALLLECWEPDHVVPLQGPFAVYVGFEGPLLDVVVTV